MFALGASSLLAALLLTATVDGAKSPVGKRIDPFVLKDVLGTTRSLDDWKDKQGGRRRVPRRRVSARPAVRSEAGASWPSATRTSTCSSWESTRINRTRWPRSGTTSASTKIGFPVLKDPGNKIADQFGAVRTPEVFLLDPSRVVRYWGQIDDQFGVGVARGKAVHHYLQDALDDVSGGKAGAHRRPRSRSAAASAASTSGPRRGT